MSIPDTALRDAKQAGRQAAQQGATATTCPYSFNGDDRERALAHLWLSAYLANRSTPSAVDYG